MSKFVCLGTIIQIFRTASTREAELIGSFFTQAPQGEPLGTRFLYYFSVM